MLCWDGSTISLTTTVLPGSTFAGLRPQLHDGAYLQQGSGSWSNKQISLKGRGDGHPSLRTRIRTWEVQEYAARSRNHKDLPNFQSLVPKEIQLVRRLIPCMTYHPRAAVATACCVFAVTAERYVICSKTCFLPPWDFVHIGDKIVKLGRWIYS